MRLAERIAEWWRARAEKRIHRQALKEFGWDGKCTCGVWLHATHGICVGSQPTDPKEEHGPEWWTYRCAVCGIETDWLVGIAPIPLRRDSLKPAVT